MIAFLILTALSAFSYVAYQKANPDTSNGMGSCTKATRNQPADMLWEALSSQFVSGVFFR
jgi:hypothetical protein